MLLPGKVGYRLALVTALALAGCTDSHHGPPESVELSFERQLTLVKNGQETRIYTESPVGDADLQRCAELENLEELLLDNPRSQLSSAGFSALKSLPKLWHLRIRGPGIDDLAAEQLAELHNLTVLNVPKGTFTDAGLRKLVQLSSLEQLRFGSPHVTDAGLKAIGELPALKRLHLIDVRMSDAALREFAKMQSLESLYIDGAQLSDAAIDELFAARPMLHVHFNQQHHDRDPHADVH